jgi:tRNA modification GTPase
VRLSALEGTGLTDLKGALCALADSIQLTVGNDLITINHRHAHALAETRACLRSALGKLDEDGPGELIASDLRGALDGLGAIAGRVDNEEILDRLFAEFCIGK